MNKNTSKLIGERIDGLLKSKSIKQKALAEELGIKPNVVSYFRNGTRTPNTELIIRIASFLDVSADYLLGLTDVKSTDLKIQEISKLTGLSEAAIVKLSLFKKSAHEDNNDQLFLDIINRFIENI
ncbi:MAG: helix-turn-helix domain-containing protein [Oscillospiraceae bacterium]